MGKIGESILNVDVKLLEHADKLTPLRDIGRQLTEIINPGVGNKSLICSNMAFILRRFSQGAEQKGR